VPVIVIKATHAESRVIFDPDQHMTTRQASVSHHCKHHQAKLSALGTADVIAAVFGADLSQIAESLNQDLVKFIWRQCVADDVFCYAAAVSCVLKIFIFVTD
jgi:hypothetical protein